VPDAVSVTTIISDLGGVLLDFDNTLYERRLAEVSPHPLSTIRAALDDHLLPDLHLGRIDPHQFHQSLSARLDLDLTIEDLSLIYADIFTPVTGTMDLLRDLQPRHRLCLLSNTNAIHWDYCRSAYPFLDLFDHHVLSHEVHAAKPDPAIYDHALKLLDTPPSSCVYIDDIPPYADAATALGLHGLTFTSPAALEHDLARLGVNR